MRHTSRSLAALWRWAGRRLSEQAVAGSLTAAEGPAVGSLRSASGGSSSSVRCLSTAWRASGAAPLGSAFSPTAQLLSLRGLATLASSPAAAGAALPHPQQAPAALLQARRTYGVGPGGPRRGGAAARRQQEPPAAMGPRRNQEIAAREVRVVFPPEEGKPATVMTLQAAIKEARHRELDLIEVTAAADPPVCKIADYEKVVYEARKKVRANERAAREARRLSEPKEVRVGCHIAENDLNVKMDRARTFVEDGYHLRLVVTFKGAREQALGREMVAFLLDQLDGLVLVKNPKQLEKPQQNQWAVLLTPAAPRPSKAA